MTTPKTDVITFRADPKLRGQLQAIQEADGITVGEQVRRALKLWIERHEQREHDRRVVAMMREMKPRKAARR